MTLLSLALSLFPLTHFLLFLGFVISAFLSSTILTFFLLLFTAVFFLYLFPLLVFRVHNYFFPLGEGMSDLSAKSYSSWWGGHQIQTLFLTFPCLEGALRLVPGVYSFWLRCWGSQIGRRIYWTPRVEIVDRSLLVIGDDVIFGHLCALCSHAVVPKNGRVRLVVRKITIGNCALIGAESRIGAGANVPGNEVVPYGKVLSLHGRRFKETTY